MLLCTVLVLVSTVQFELVALWTSELPSFGLEIIDTFKKGDLLVAAYLVD